MDGYITATEAAKILDIHAESLRRLVRKGKIKSDKFGGVLYFDREYINSYALTYDPTPGNVPGPREIKKRKRQERPGYIYILLAENGLRKIGRTYNPKTRLRSAFSMSPVDIEIESVHKVKSPILTEKRLHQIFNPKRVRGEWFNLSESDVKNISETIGGIQAVVTQKEKENGSQLPLIDMLS